MFFNTIPRWQDISTCQKILMVTSDIMYSCVTLGLPVGIAIFTGSTLAFFGVAAVETACCMPPTLPGCLSLMSIFKPPQEQAWSDEAKDHDWNFTV
jgi:hypothetical protein